MDILDRSGSHPVAHVRGPVGWFAVAAGRMAYTTPGPETDPTAMRLRQLTTGEDRRIAGPNAGNVVLSASLVAWLTERNTITVAPTRGDASGAVVSGGLSIPARLAVDGPLIAWGTETLSPAAGFTVTLHVGRPELPSG
jgi:hypothetical protein